MRDKEIRTLTWAQIHFDKNYLAVGRSKTEAGDGRTIPLNAILLPVLLEYKEWYKEKFGATEPEWYVFPFGKPSPSDPTRPVTTLKTAWNNVRDNAKVQGRFHDNRHTLITELAESGAGDETIMDIAGHVSKQMLRHYSHIRMEAKRKALESIVPAQKTSVSYEEQSGYAEGSLQKSLQSAKNGLQTGASTLSAEDKNPIPTEIQKQGCSELPANTQHFEGESLQKALQSCNSAGHRGTGKARKSMKIIGSSGRTRTYNPSVNRRSCNTWSTFVFYGVQLQFSPNLEPFRHVFWRRIWRKMRLAEGFEIRRNIARNNFGEILFGKSAEGLFQPIPLLETWSWTERFLPLSRLIGKRISIPQKESLAPPPVFV
jgi:hypothetical protein